MHAIRLRGPWQLTPLARWSVADGRLVAQTQNLPAATETDVPADWSRALGSEFFGQVEYLRRFGLPTNLTADEQVLLVVDRVDWQATITLNGELLGRQTHADGSRRYDITRRLKPRNELRLVVELSPPVSNSAVREAFECQGPAGGLVGEVRLEIG